MTINHLSITPVTREQTRRDLVNHIERKTIKNEEIKKTLSMYLNYKQYKWAHKTIKTPFHCDPSYKTNQLLRCLKGNMRTEIYRNENDIDFRKSLIETHQMAQGFSLDFSKNQLKQDNKGLKIAQSNFARYSKILGYLESLVIKNGEVTNIKKKTGYL